MNDILSRALEMKDQIIADRRYLHQNPEVGLETVQTAAYVTKRLKEMGYDPKPCGANGVVATVGKSGKTILLRADMDALPMQEKSNLSFASKTDEAAHTCGHDMHTAMLLGAAQILKEYESDLQGTVKFMFQSGEEPLSGAKTMLNDALLENPKVDVAMAMHVFAPFEAGKLLYRAGAFMASSDNFRIIVEGVGAHGAMPELGVDPINIAAHIHIALQEILAREISAQDAVMLTIGKFVAGSAPNIIPQTAIMEGTIRTFSEEVRTFALKRMKEISAGIARSFRGNVTIEMIESVPSTINDEKLLSELLGYVDLLQDDQLKAVKINPLQGSEDFSLVAKEVPSVYFGLGAKEDAEGAVESQHNPHVIFNESVLSQGAAIHAICALEWLKNNV